MLNVTRLMSRRCALGLTKTSNRYFGSITPKTIINRPAFYSCNNTKFFPVKYESESRFFCSNFTSFRFAHTSGDKELVEFLKDEIKLEKEGRDTAGKLPKLKGFELSSTDGPNVILTKKSDKETVSIKLNVNHAVDEAAGEEPAGQEPEKEPQMVCKPSFLIEINKGGDKTLAIQCVFPPEDDLPPPDQAEQYDDLIEIQDVALLDKGQEWTDDVYCLSGGLMDGNLYDMLLKMLEERGIDGELVHQIIEFSTTYEHNKYIDLLEQLQAFASSK